MDDKFLTLLSSILNGMTGVKQKYYSFRLWIPAKRYYYVSYNWDKQYRTLRKDVIMTTNSLPGLHSPQANDPRSYLEHDRWTCQQLEDYQARALQACREYAYARSPFYQRFHRGLTDRP